MANAFSAALDAVFRDTNHGADATFQPGSTGDGPLAGNVGAGGDGSVAPVSCRVIFVSPDTDFAIPGLGVQAPKLIVDVRAAEVATVAEGDIFVIEGVPYAVTNSGQPDIQRLTWRCNLRPL